MKINLFAIVDNTGRIYYSGDTEQNVQNFKEDNDWLKKLKIHIVKLTGQVPEGNIK